MKYPLPSLVALAACCRPSPAVSYATRDSSSATQVCKCLLAECRHAGTTALKCMPLAHPARQSTVHQTPARLPNKQQQGVPVLSVHGNDACWPLLQNWRSDLTWQHPYAGMLSPKGPWQLAATSTSPPATAPATGGHIGSTMVEHLQRVRQLACNTTSSFFAGSVLVQPTAPGPGQCRRIVVLLFFLPTLFSSLGFLAHRKDEQEFDGDAVRSCVPMQHLTPRDRLAQCVDVSVHLSVFGVCLLTWTMTSFFANTVLMQPTAPGPGQCRCVAFFFLSFFLLFFFASFSLIPMQLHTLWTGLHMVRLCRSI